jgi:hypothetical protein
VSSGAKVAAELATPGGAAALAMGIVLGVALLAAGVYYIIIAGRKKRRNLGLTSKREGGEGQAGGPQRQLHPTLEFANPLQRVQGGGQASLPGGMAAAEEEGEEASDEPEGDPPPPTGAESSTLFTNPLHRSRGTGVAAAPELTDPWFAQTSILGEAAGGSGSTAGRSQNALSSLRGAPPQHLSSQPFSARLSSPRRVAAVSPPLPSSAPNWVFETQEPPIPPAPWLRDASAASPRSPPPFVRKWSASRGAYYYIGLRDREVSWIKPGAGATILETGRDGSILIPVEESALQQSEELLSGSGSAAAAAAAASSSGGRAAASPLSPLSASSGGGGAMPDSPPHPPPPRLAAAGAPQPAAGEKAVPSLGSDSPSFPPPAALLPLAAPQSNATPSLGTASAMVAAAGKTKSSVVALLEPPSGSFPTPFVGRVLLHEPPQPLKSQPPSPTTSPPQLARTAGVSPYSLPNAPPPLPAIEPLQPPQPPPAEAFANAWLKRASVRGGAPFYVNLATGESVWEEPRGPDCELFDVGSGGGLVKLR